MSYSLPRYCAMVLMVLLLACCQRNMTQHERLESAVGKQLHQAERLTEHYARVLESARPDSVRDINSTGHNAAIYIFNHTGLCYWTDNTLSVSDVRTNVAEQWFFQELNNVYALCRWTPAGTFAILTIVPIRHRFPFENRELRNTYYEPFDFMDPATSLADGHINNDYDINDSEGRYLFSVAPTADDMQQENQVLNSRFADSFSYQQLSHDKDEVRARRIRTFYLLSILFFLLYFGYALYIVLRHTLRRDMRVTDRLQVVFAFVLITAFVVIYIFMVRFARHTYQTKQRTDLRRKTQYVQKSLQEIYFWEQTLDNTFSSSLNITLKDLSYTYQTDIHVYDIEGRLIGSSQPELFNNNIIGKNMAPEPYFADNPNCLLEEHISRLSYLSAYTECYNGQYDLIGYIAVPLFISEDEVNEEVDALLSWLLPICFFIAIMSIMLVVWLSREITRPLYLVSEKMQHFAIGRHNEKIEYSDNDEFGQLIGYYNDMVDQLEHSISQLKQSERQDAWKTMARQVAHEIKNPLTPMRLTIQQMQRLREIDPERFNTYFDQASPRLIEQIDNLSHIATSFSDFAKMPEPVIGSVDIAQKLSAVVGLFEANQRNIPIEMHGPTSGICVTTDGDQITQVLNNLIKNAIQALSAEQDPMITVTLTTTERWATINVIDNGVGVPDDIKDKIFTPNFTTKSTGSGLGLAISKRIVEASGGKISFHSVPHQTTFTVELPRTCAE